MFVGECAGYGPSSDHKESQVSVTSVCVILSDPESEA